MGAITRAAANNFTTGGVIQPAAINDTSVASLTELENVAAGGAMTLISEQTASSSASISFTSGIDSTYPIYKFVWINCHAGSNNHFFRFYASTDGGSSYGATQTSTAFRAYHNEAGADGTLGYYASGDGAQTTSSVILTTETSNLDDHATSGEVFLYNPSSTTFVKHFISNSNTVFQNSPDYTMNDFRAGYFNTTSAINACQFAFNVGNIDAGTIKLYGISGS